MPSISDTALWVAVYRARETDRPDALFRDPLAYRLAGTRGEQIAQKIGENSSKVLIVTEGLLVYLSPAEVGSLATDLAQPRSLQSWKF